MSNPRPSLCAVPHLLSPNPRTRRHTSTINRPQGLFREVPK
jgi:hypothetical protein